jgi:DNA polymerase
MKQEALFSVDAIQPSGEAPLSAWRERAYACTGCKLHESRKRVVFGMGNSNRPDICFVGEAPRAAEEVENVPFGGNGGDLLKRMMEKMGLKPERAYFCNVVCCRPLDLGQAPGAEEIEACEPFLHGQLRVVQPRVIIALGLTATETLLRKRKHLFEMRGKWWEWQGIPVRPTFHPNGMFGKEGEKHRASCFVDLQAAMNKLRELNRPPDHKSKG